MNQLPFLLWALVAPLNAGDIEPIQPRAPAATTVEAVVHTPITFKFDLQPKPGWDAKDKVQALKNRWTVSSEALKYLRADDGTFYCWAPPGFYELRGEQTLINWTKQDVDEREYVASITVTGKTPVPPDPPVPPTPGDNPLPGVGFRALIVYEKDDVASYPRSQQSLFSSAAVRGYLNTHAAKGPTGHPDWRIFDKDTDMTSESPLWQGAMKHPRASLPWFIVSNGTQWGEGPLPKDEIDLLAIFRKFGGQ